MATTPRKRPLRTAPPSATSTSTRRGARHPGRGPSVGATIYSVAERAGVSIATVSRVLQGSTVVSDATRQKVLDAVDALHYVPLGAARSLAVRHHEAYGLVLPELTGPYYSELLMGFESRAAELGQSVMLMLTDGKTDLPRAVRSPRHPRRRHRGARLGRDAARRRARPARPQARRHHRRRSGRRSGHSTSVAAENAHSAEQLTEHVLRPRPHPARLRR